MNICTRNERQSSVYGRSDEHDAAVDAILRDTGPSRNVKYDQDKPPLVRGCLRQFPDSLEAIAFVSLYGTVKYKVKFEDRSWHDVIDGEKRYLDADGRHLIRDGYDDESGLLHAAHHLWDAAATLQLLLESGTPLVDPVRGVGPHGIINETEGEQKCQSK